MSIHEYQSMGLLGQYGMAIPKGHVASNPEEAFQVAKSVGKKSVVKAQVLAGGRGKGTFDNGFQGGVKIANSPEEAKSIASQMLGHRLVTKQTGSVGRPCSKGPVIIGSYRGGMDIEAVAKEDPNAIVKLPVPSSGLTEASLKAFTTQLRVEPQCQAQAMDLVKQLLRLFKEKDATLVEINPLVQTKADQMVCIDAKINFDDNAAFRQKDIAALRDESQEDPREVRAAEYDLNYIGLDGSIGCLVNGAGLAMATMDIIKLHGGEPANFLDVGGSATREQVSAAIGILASDPRVRAILVNIFGGIMKCDVVAGGIIDGIRTHHVAVPVVVRLQGTNEQEAKEMMRSSGLSVFSQDDLDAAARKVVAVSH